MRCGLRLRVGDELVALGDTLGDVLVVQALRELDDAGARGRGAGGVGSARGPAAARRGDGSLLGERLGSGAAAAGLGAGLVCGELRLQLVVLGDRLAPLDDDLVEEVVDLVGVEALLEPDVLELLGDDVIGGQCHGGSSFERSGRWPMSLGAMPRDSRRSYQASIVRARRERVDRRPVRGDARRR